MERALILVEGQTEEIFVRDVLNPHLQSWGVFLEHSVITTKRVKDGPNFKGGSVTLERLIRELTPFCHDSNVVAITTMVDYYGLGSGFTASSSDPTQNVSEFGTTISQRIQDPRFRPFFVLHEFEALLYADPSVCADYLECPQLQTVMLAAVEECGEPERVNNFRETAPSKRIDACLAAASKIAYQKTLGPHIVELIGLAKIRQECPHFDEWLTWLEALGTP